MLEKDYVPGVGRGPEHGKGKEERMTRQLCSEHYKSAHAAVEVLSTNWHLYTGEFLSEKVKARLVSHIIDALDDLVDEYKDDAPGPQRERSK